MGYAVLPEGTGPKALDGPVLSDSYPLHEVVASTRLCLRSAAKTNEIMDARSL